MSVDAGFQIPKKFRQTNAFYFVNPSLSCGDIFLFLTISSIEMKVVIKIPCVEDTNLFSYFVDRLLEGMFT